MNQPAGPGAQPPPPPPKKSGWMKWALIGCGVLGLIVVICCGAPMVFTYVAFQKVKAEIGERAFAGVRNHPKVQEHLGEVSKVEPRLNGFHFKEEDGRQKAVFVADATGSKGRGVLRMTIDTRKQGQHEEVVFEGTLEKPDGSTVRLGSWRVTKDGQQIRVEGEQP